MKGLNSTQKKETGGLVGTKRPMTFAKLTKGIINMENKVVEYSKQLAEDHKREWYKEFAPKHDKILEILQFNDVYNVDEKEDDGVADKDPMELRIKAGVARFVNAMKVYRSKYKLVAFSGDLFFPSRMSTMFDGEQMVAPFNLMNPSVSCLGNHGLDHGYETAKKLID